ncbi:MAG: hypothetical protein AB7J35_15800 [Dehalococcoidia bacterium]
MTAHPRSPTTRTTIPIASELLAAVDQLIAGGEIASRSAVIDLALRRLFWDLENAEMFEAFEEAAEDPAWRKAQVALAEEGVASGWEALTLDEHENQE